MGTACDSIPKLNKECCAKCCAGYYAVWYNDNAYRKQLLVNFYNARDKGICNCPEYGNSEPMKIVEEPPPDCPYLLEHLVYAQ